MKSKIKNIVAGIKQRLSFLSYRTGVVIMLLCIVCYIVSFAQMMLPWSIATKGVFWTIFFGLAKTFQYTALPILGAEGLKRLKRLLGVKRKKSDDLKIG